MSQTAPKRVGVFVSRLSAFHLSSPCEPHLLQECIDAWRACVSEQLASHVVPVFYLHGRLTLAADSSVWHHKLLQQRSALLRQLRYHRPFRQLGDIHIRVAPRGTRRPAKTTPAPVLSAAARSVITESAQGIADTDLQAALRRLADTASQV